jgi:hypothetical protein
MQQKGSSLSGSDVDVFSWPEKFFGEYPWESRSDLYFYRDSEDTEKKMWSQLKGL